MDKRPVKVSGVLDGRSWVLGLGVWLGAAGTRGGDTSLSVEESGGTGIFLLGSLNSCGPVFADLTLN